MSAIHIYRKEDLKLKSDIPGASMWAVALDRTMLTYFEIEPNTKFPDHSHEAEQITLILEGELTFTYGAETTVLKAGDVIAIPSNEVHSAFTGDTPCKAVDAWSPVRKEFLENP
jgi:quercetin dioxygenase-like cupin family protein